MSEIRKDCLYAKTHEWLKQTAKPKTVTVGISDFAQSSLGDVTYLQMPALGKTFRKGEILGTVESVKAVSDIYAPVSGTVTKVNEPLNNDPSPINSDPFGNGWLVEMEASDENEIAGLLNADAYANVAL